MVKDILGYALHMRNPFALMENEEKQWKAFMQRVTEIEIESSTVDIYISI